MKKFLLFLGVALAATLSVSEASAQIKVGEGQVSVALESNTSYYTEDATLVDIKHDKPSDRTLGNYGSNNYLKVDYNLKQFSAGVQVDGYLPPLYGYELYNYVKGTYPGKENFMFLSLYTQIEAQNWGIRIGDIYDQFGNGLVFRAYEDRALAFNNSLLGARAYYNLNNVVTLKALAGKPRFYNDRSDNWIYGTDLSLSVSDLMGWNNGALSLEGSYVGRYDSDISAFNEDVFDSSFNAIGITNPLSDIQNLNMVSGRVNFEHSGFSLRGEYAAKLNEDKSDAGRGPAKGNAIFVDMGYNYKRFSASASFRRMENMSTVIDPVKPDHPGNGSGNVMNYIPSLTRQHTYSLANLNPYSGTSVFTGGEVGGQVDLYYSLRNPKARGKYWNFHANFSMFNSIDHPMINIITGEVTEIREGRNAWLDFNLDIERQWNKTLKTTFLYSMQKWDEMFNKGDEDASQAHYCTSHIFVGDVTYKFNKKHSVRLEAQYLSSNDYEGDWVAGTIEYNFAPKFSIYVSDMWNCEEMKDGKYGNKYYHESVGQGDPNNDDAYWHELLHYYQVGASYTHNSLRVQFSYGRNRAGYVCSGGVCRMQPAFTGANLALTYSF